MKYCFKVRICVYLIFFILFLVGCENKEYQSFVSDYRTTYYKIVDYIDISHPYDSIKRLQTEEIDKYLEHMESIITTIKGKVPKNRQERYKNFCKYYDGLKFLKESYKRWDKLAQDERGRVDAELTWIGMMKSLYKNEDEVW